MATSNAGEQGDFPLDLGKVRRIDFAAEPARTSALFREALSYLLSKKWCKDIRTAYEGIVEEGIIGIYLFSITPASPSADDWVWVIVGDLPPAYIAIVDCPNPACALDAYIGAMMKWVDAAKAGEPVEELIPVNVEANSENALALERRLTFLDERILADYSDDLT